MEIQSPDIPSCLKPTPERVAELDRLGDAIADLSAHLEAATARLLVPWTPTSPPSTRASRWL